MSNFNLIPISDIKMLDTSKISVYSLNNRYIDSEGHIYALRYDRIKRKVTVVRILISHGKDALNIHRKMQLNRHNSNNNEIEINEDTSKNLEDNDGIEEDIFNPDQFLTDTFKLLKMHKDRYKGIMMNISNSNIVPESNRGDYTQLEDIFRNIELDGIQKISKIDKYRKELVEYPRSVTYYQAKLDSNGRKIYEDLALNKGLLMKFIYYYEMHNSLNSFYQLLQKFTIEMKELVESHDPEESKLSTNEKQSLEDGLISIESTLTEIEDILDGLKKLHAYISNSKNLIDN